VFTQVLEWARGMGWGRLRQKLRSPAGRAVYSRRKAVVEQVLGVLKQQRGMRQFRTRSLTNVGIEFNLAALAYNLTRLYRGRNP